MLLELLTLASLLITSRSQCTNFEQGRVYYGYYCLYGGNTNIVGNPMILDAYEVCMQQTPQGLELNQNCGPPCTTKGDCTSPATCLLLNDKGYCNAADPSCLSSNNVVFTGYDCETGTNTCSTGQECVAVPGNIDFASCGTCQETCNAMYTTTCDAQNTCPAGEYCAAMSDTIPGHSEPCPYHKCQACPTNACAGQYVNSQCDNNLGLCKDDTEKDGCLICECTGCGDGKTCAQTGYTCDVTTGCGTCIDTTVTCPNNDCDDGNGGVYGDTTQCDIKLTSEEGECVTDNLTACTYCADPCDAYPTTCVDSTTCGYQTCADFTITAGTHQKTCDYQQCRDTTCDDLGFITTCHAQSCPAGEYCAAMSDTIPGNSQPCAYDECKTCPANDDCVDKLVDDECNNGLGACKDVYGKVGCLICDECAVGWDNECDDPLAPNNVCTHGESYCVMDWTDGTNNGCTKNKCVACAQNDCYGRARTDACVTATDTEGTCQLQLLSPNTMCLYCQETTVTCPVTPCDDGNGNVGTPGTQCHITGTVNNILGECIKDYDTQCTDCIDPCADIISQYNTCAQDSECGDKICADFRDVYTGTYIQKDCDYKRCRANPCDDSIYSPQCDPGTSDCIGTEFDTCNTHEAIFDAGTADPPATNTRDCGQCECAMCTLDADNCETGKYCAGSNNYGDACGYCATCECTSAGVSCNNGAGICTADSSKCGFICQSLCNNYCSQYDQPRDYPCNNNAGTCQFDDVLGCKTCNLDPCSRFAFDDQCDRTLNDCDIGDCVATTDTVHQCDYNECEPPPQCPDNICKDGTNIAPVGEGCTLENGLLGTCELYGNTDCVFCQRNRCLDCQGKPRDADCNMDDGTPGTCQWDQDKQCRVCNKDPCSQTAYDSECVGGCTLPEKCTSIYIDTCQKDVCQDPCAQYGTTCVADGYCSVGETCQDMENNNCQWSECAGCSNECDDQNPCGDHQACSVAEHYGCDKCEVCDECDTTDTSTCLRDINNDGNPVQGECVTQQDTCNRCQFVVACSDECNLDGSGTPCSDGTLCTESKEIGLCTTCDDCVSWCLEDNACYNDFDDDGTDDSGVCEKATNGCNECVCVNECEMDGSLLCDEGFQCAQSMFGCNICEYCNECEDAGKCTDESYGRCESNNNNCNVCVYGCEDQCKMDGTMDCDLGKICVEAGSNTVDECNTCDDCVDCVFDSSDACKLDEDGDSVFEKIGECVKDDITGCTECKYECDGCTSNDETGDGICEVGDDTSTANINRQYCDLSNDELCGVCIDCECTVDDDCNKDITANGVRECQIFDFRERCGICATKCDEGCVLGDADNRCINQVCLDTTSIGSDCGTCEDEQCSGDECSEDRKCIDAYDDTFECVIDAGNTCGTCDEKCIDECDIAGNSGCEGDKQCEENKRGCGECVEADEYCEEDDTPAHIKGHSIWKLIAGLIEGNLDEVVCEMCFCHNGNVNRLKTCINRFKLRALVTEDWVEDIFNSYCDKDTYPPLGWKDTSTNTASATETKQCPLENIRIKPAALIDTGKECSCKSLYCDKNEEWKARECTAAVTDNTCKDRGLGEECDVSMCEQYTKVMRSGDPNCVGLCVDNGGGVHDGNSVNTFNVMIGFSVVMIVFGWM